MNSFRLMRPRCVANGADPVPSRLRHISRASSVVALLLCLLTSSAWAQPLPLPDAFQVDAFEVKGMTILEPREAANVLAPYAGRFLTIGELQEAVDAVTELYQQHGYLQASAYLPEQDLEDGAITIQVREIPTR